MKIAYNPKTAAVITTATAANDDILFDLNAKKVWAKGLRMGADWADISSKPSSLKNPYALTISLNGTSQGPYDGSAAKNINITPSSIGAATSGHNHDGRYVYNYGETQMDGASKNKNALGMSTTSGISGDWWHILQAAWNDEYRWNSQIAFPTLNRNGMYYRSGLDDNTAWGSWIKLLDVGNSYVTDGKGVINGTTITQVDNATNANNASVASKVYGQVGDTGSHELVRCNMNNDQFRIIAGSNGNNNGWAEIATADDGNEPIYVRQYTGVFSSVKRTLTLLDANGYTHFPGYINIGGNENNNSSPDRVWGSNGSDSYLRSYRTSALRVAYAVNANSATTASSADKLTTARNIALGTDLRGSANFDGSSNITISANINACTVGVGGTNGLPFKRIAHFETGNSYNDNALLLYISLGYINGSNGICRVEFRTDNISSSSTSVTASAAVRWLVRNGYGLDSLYAGYYVTTGKAYIDIYLKTTGSYQGTVIRVLLDSRGGINSNVLLINSYYYSDSDHKEAYSSIEDASQALYNRAYTRIVSGSDVGTVNYANSTGSANSATKLQTARTIWGQRFDGTGDVDGTLRIRQTTNNYCEGIRIQTADGTWATIILGATSDYGTNANAWSIHRKSDNNFAISRNSSDGTNGLVMTSVGMGLGTTTPTHRLDVRGDTKITGSIRDLAIGGGIYWDPHAESAGDSSDAASITVVRAGVAGGTTLVLSLLNDANDTILFKTNDAARLYHNNNFILTSKDTKVTSGKGYIDNTEITQVNNASKLQTARNLWGNSFDGTKGINGSIVFPAIGDTATSNKISWSGSSDGADIYYLTTATDLGNLVLNVKDDTNAYIQLALNGVFKSHFDVANSYWTGKSALADKWTTARTFTIGNTAKNVDGSGNVSWSLAEIGVNDTWRAVQVNGTSIGNNILNLCGSTYIGLTNVNGKVTFSLVGSGTTANQAILSNGTANGWTLKTLNIDNWDTAYNFVSTITGEDADKVINKWDEIVNFLAGITEDNKLNTLLSSKLSILLLSANEILTTKTNNALFWVNTKDNASSITTGPFTDHPYALLSVTNFSQNDTNGKFFYRSRLAFSSAGDLKVASCHHQGEYKLDETWYNVLTSKNSGINGSTIKLNGTSITVYSSSTADGRYVKKSGDTMTGTLNFANYTWNNVGDDVAIGDHNIAGCLGIKGLNASPGLAFYNSSNTLLNILVGTANLFLRVSGDNVFNILDNSTTHINNNTITINGTSLTVSKSDHNHDNKYLCLDGSNTMTGQIKSSYSAGTWIAGCTNAILKATSDGYNSLICAPIKSGNICISAWTNEENLNFGYAKKGKTDNNFDTKMYWDAPNNNLHAAAFTGHLNGTADNATNSDKLDGYHANGLLTALSNSNRGISLTVGGTTKSLSNISVGDADTVDGEHASAFTRIVGRHSINTDGTAPYRYIHLFRIANSNGYSTVDCEIDLRTRYHSAKLEIRIVTSQHPYGANGSSISIIKKVINGRSCILWVLQTVQSSNYNYYDIYYESGAWNSGVYDIILRSNNGVLVFEHKGTKLDALPDNVSVVNNLWVMWNDIAEKPSSFTPAAHDHDGRYLRLNGLDTMQGNLKLFSYGSSYIGRGSGDKSGEDFTEANIVIRSWYGISFKSFDDKVRTYIDTRTGNIGTKGKFIGNLTGNATSATKVIVNQHTANDADYPLVWSNLSNTSNATENQLHKSWKDLYYNPKNKRLFVGGSVSTANINATGTVTSAGFKHSGITKNADLYVLTAGGGYTFLNLTSNELAHEFSKNITVTSEWLDIEDFYGGNLSFLTLPGTYIVLVYYTTNSANSMYEGYFSGIMSWYTGTTNSNNADEIVLHRAGHAYANTIYLRTRESLNSEENPYTKLQISANSDLKLHTYKFKFKRIC